MSRLRRKVKQEVTMIFKNRIALILCAVLTTVSFLYPFSGRMVYAEQTAAEVQPEETAATEEDEPEEETAEREKTASESETGNAETEQGPKTESAEDGGQAGAGKDESKTETEAEETKPEETKAEETEAEEAEPEETEPEETEAEKTEAGETEAGETKVEGAKAEKTTPEKETAGIYPEMPEENVQEEETQAGDMEIPALQQVFARRSASARSSIGIDPDHPRDGQQNRYEYKGLEETWIVPAEGEYEIYCYGAGGGDGRGWSFPYTGTAGSESGSKGAMRAGRVHLSKGMVLCIHAGGCGGSVGNISYNNKIFGTAGWNDGVKGVYASTGGDDDNNNGSLGTGGGGGSSYVLCNGVKIISAAGGDGGGAWYESPRGNASRDGGGGGGVTVRNNTSAIEWDTAALDRNEGAANAGNGYVLVRAVDVVPDISLSARKEWTNEDVIITAQTSEDAQQLPPECFSWERDAEGNPVWTGRSTCAVCENGIYTCKVRDKQGKSGEASIEISCIDKLRPIIRVEQSGDEWTTGEVTLTALVEDAEGTEAYARSGVPKQRYSWQEDENGNPIWTDEESRTVDQNGVYVCRGRDNVGNVAKTEICVSRIDRTPPEVSCERPVNWYEGTVKIKVSARDLQPDGTEGCGLDEKPYSVDGVHFTDLAELEVEAEGVYSIWVRDRLGNSKETKFTFSHDKKESPGQEKKEDSGQEKKDKNKDKGGGTAAPARPPLPEAPAMEPQQPEQIAEEGGTAMQVYTEETENTDNMTERAENRAEIPDLAAPLPLEEGPKQTRKKMPVIQEKREEKAQAETIEEIPKRKRTDWKKGVLYSAWVAVVFCGLIWLLFCLVFEHVTVYRKDENGKYCKAGRCAIIRKKEYKQIDLMRLMGRERERDYKVCFAAVFVLLHKKEKVLLRTCYGVELRNVAKEIEILACNS